jgi:hypothetical protein
MLGNSSEVLLLAGGTMQGKLNIPASVAGSAYFNLTPGANPTTLVNGDLWIDSGTNTLKSYIGGSTRNIFTTGGGTFVGGITFRTATAGSSSFTIPHGVTPTTPANGDVWTTTAGLFVHVNGTTVGPLGSGGGGGVTDGDKGDVVISGSGTVYTLDAGVVSNAKMADMPSGTIKGNQQIGNATPQDITFADLTVSLSTFSTSAQGVVPGSGGGTANFLRADGNWAPPPGGGGGGYTVVTQAAGYTFTATSGEVVLLCSGTVDQTIVLPTAVGNTAKYTIKKTNLGGRVIIDPNGTQTVDGGLTATLGRQYESVTLISDNANWWII